MDMYQEMEDDYGGFEMDSSAMYGDEQASEWAEGDQFTVKLQIACSVCGDFVGKLNAYVRGQMELSDFDDEFRRKTMSSPWLVEVVSVFAAKARHARRVCDMVRDFTERAGGSEFASEVFRKVQDLRTGGAGLAMYLLYATLLVSPDHVKRGSWQLFWLGPEFGLDPLSLDEFVAWREKLDAGDGDGQNSVCGMIMVDNAELFASELAMKSSGELARAVRPQIPRLEYGDPMAVSEWDDGSQFSCAAFHAELRDGEELEYLLAFCAFTGSPRCAHELISRGAKTLDAFVWAVRGGSSEVLEVLHLATLELPLDRLEAILLEAAKSFELGMFSYIAQRRNIPQYLARRVFDQAVRMSNAAAAYDILHWACDTRVRQYIPFLALKRADVDSLRQLCHKAGNRELAEAIAQIRSGELGVLERFTWGYA